MKNNGIFYVIEKPLNQYWTGNVNFGEDNMSEWTKSIYEACHYTNKKMLEYIKKMYQIEGEIVQHQYCPEI